MLSIVVAMDKNRLIGRDNQLPWHLPADLAHFKRVTMAKPIVMGRKTYESIGRPLPGRRNIVLSRQANYQAEGCEIYSSLDEVITQLSDEPEVMIIGGAKLFEQALPVVSRLYLTFIDDVFEGNVYFPEWDQMQWEVAEEKQYKPDEKNKSTMRFVTLARKKNN